MVRDFNDYAVKVHITPRDSLLLFGSWNKPRTGWVKVNVDAHVDSGMVRGLGAVIRDENGCILVAGVRRIHALLNVDTCEAAAALLGVQLASRFGFQFVQLEGDSLNVVKAIEQRIEGASPIHLFYDCILSSSSSFSGFSCSFVHHKGNSLAHAVARWDTDLAIEKIYMEPFPKIC